MNFEVIVDAFPKLISGTGLTIELTLLSVSIGLCMAVPLALSLTSRNKMLKLPVQAFVFYFRGTPLLVQMFLIYYGSGQFRGFLTDIGLWVFFRDAMFCAVLSLALNHAAYAAEILRGGIIGITHGEIEAAKACGMSRALRLRRIILPKAFRLAWPAYTNEVVFMLQATSLVSTITVMDLTGQARTIAGRTYAIYESYCTAALLYLVMVYLVIKIFRHVEWKMTGYLRPVDDIELVDNA